MFCGIDPGRFKIGIAFADGEKLLYSAIIPKVNESVICAALENGEWHLLDDWRREGRLANLAGRSVEKIYLGNGTSSSELGKKLERLCVEVTDERGTTLKGRKLYWKLHPPRGLWRLVPTSLRTPPRDIDDLAAFCIIKAPTTK